MVLLSVGLLCQQRNPPSCCSAVFAVIVQLVIVGLPEEQQMPPPAPDAVFPVIVQSVIVALAGQAGYQVDVEALLAEVTAARDDVKLAGSQLETAILTAAEAGRDDTFDQALEDVISAALQRLMTANESLFVESQALSAVVTVLRDARVNGESEVGQDRIDVTAAWARLDAHTEITEMRASWDRVARDVFSAFVTRLVAQQADQSESTDSE